MKQIILIVFLISSSLLFSQTEISIQIIADEKVNEITVSSLDMSNSVTKFLINGKGKINTYLSSSDQYTFEVNNKKMTTWLNSGKVGIDLSLENNELKIINVVNSPVFYKSKEYFEKLSIFMKDLKSDSEFIKEAILVNDQDAFVLVPINAYLKLNQNNPKELLEIKKFLEKQPKSTKEKSIYELINKRLNKLLEVKKVELTKYKFKNSSNKIVKITNNKNKKYRILDFWFTSCPPCIKEHNDLLNDKTILKNINAELIGISTDKDYKRWSNYLIKRRIPWKNYIIEDDSIIKDLAIWSFPTYVIIDNDNNIIGSYSNVEETIKALK